MKLGREVSRHNELANWRNTHRFESVMATKWLILTISETEPVYGTGSHEVAFSLPSITARNRLSVPKLLPWASLFALDDPITVLNTGALKAS